MQGEKTHNYNTVIVSAPLSSYNSVYVAIYNGVDDYQ